MSLKKVGLQTVLIIIGIVVGIGGTFLYIQKYGIPSKKVLQNVAMVEESKVIQEMADKVSKLIVLPTGEQPVMATITDAKSLAKDQAFYADTQDGDIVLIYQKALKAIIYSPARNIIVNVGPVTVQPESTDTADKSAENNTVTTSDTEEE